MRKNLFLPVILFTMLTGCSLNNDKANKVMDLAEYYLESRPDTALSLLMEIPNPESFEGKDQARFALLAVQALHKNYYDFESDSLIFLALSYYQDRNEIIPKAKSHLYYGHFLFDLDMFEDAQEHYQKVIEILENSNEVPKVLGMAYEGMGRIGIVLKSHPDVKHNFRKSLEIFTKIKDSIAICNANINLGLDFLSNGEMDSAYFHYNKVLDISELIEYPEKGKLFQNLGLYYRAIEDYNKAESYFLQAIAQEENDIYYNSLANMYWRKKDYDKARIYINKCLTSKRPNIQAEANYLLFDIAKANGDYEAALNSLESCNNIGDEYIEKSNYSHKELISLSRDFLQARFDKIHLKNKNRMKNLIIAIIIILSIGASVGVHFFDKYRNNKKRMKEMQDDFNRNIQEITKYRGLLAHYVSENDSLKKNNQKEISDLQGRIDLLTEQNKKLQLRMKNQGKMITIEQNAEIEQFVSGFLVYYNLVKISPRYKIVGEDLTYLLSFLNFVMNDFIGRLNKETDVKLTNHELQLACLIRLGYSNERIGVFFNSQSDSVSRAKSRLKTRLNLSLDIKLDEYLRLF